MTKIKKISEGVRISPIHSLVLVLLVLSLLPINISLIAENTMADENNTPPVAIAEPSLQVVYVGEEAWFYGNRSYDPDGWIVSYDWYFGDGTNNTGVTTSHVYVFEGNYTVTLIVTDNGGLTDNDTCDVVVLDMPPPPPPPPPCSDDWAMFNHDPQHTGFSTSDAPDASSLLWTFNGQWPMTSPSVADGMVFVVHGEPFVCALNESTGATIWNHEIPGFPSQPVVANGRVYVSTLRWGNISDEVHIYCFDEFSGELIWGWDTGELALPPSQPLWLEGPPLTPANGHIYFGLSVMPDPGNSDGSMIICLDDSTGDIIWTVDVSDLGLEYMNIPLTIADDKIFVSSGSQIYALDENNGDLLWTFFESGLSWFWSAPAFVNGKLFIGCDNTDLFYCLNANTGNIIWQTSLDGEYSYTSPAAAYEKVFFGARCYFPMNETNETIIDPIFALDQNTGDVVWRYDTPALVISSPAVADNKVFNSYEDGTVRALDVETGSVIWTYPTLYPSWFCHQSLAIAYGKLFASMGNILYVFGPGGPGNQPPVAIAEPSFQIVNVGEEAWFNGSLSYDPDGYIVSWDWDFGDGALGSGIWVAHNYTTAGTYNVTLTVTDDDGATGSCVVFVMVEDGGPPPGNIPPVAIAEPPIQIVNVGEEAWFSGNLSFDPDGYIVSYDWDFGDGTNGTGVYTTHNYTLPGGYLVILTVTDNGSATNSDCVIVIVEEGPPPGNLPPVAIAEPPIQIINVGEETWFNGSLSYDPDGYIVSWDWDFGDGTNGSGVTITHVYTAPGNYTVTLTVTDDDGLSDSDWVYVIVDGNETNPVILRTDPADGQVEVPLNYSITVVFSNNMDPTTLNWTINPDQGGWTEAWSMDTTVLKLIHSNPFDLSTMYEVEIVEVKDIDGYPLVPGPAPNPWQFVTKGENLPPLAIAIPEIQHVYVYEEAWFDGSLSSDPDGYIVSYDWDFGDGTFGSGMWVTHDYTTAGTYNVTLTVTDDDGATDSDCALVIVEESPPPGNLPPVAIAEPPIQIVYVGEQAWFSGNLSFDPDGYIVSYDWDFGDGTNGCAIWITHNYTTPGTYNVTLTVTDDDGATDSDCVLVIVEESPPPGNLPPVAIADPPFQIVFIGEEAWFSGILSFDPDGYIVSYDWDFGDGTNGSGIWVTHDYTTAGTYNVTLTVTDDDGTTDSDCALVIVEESPPPGNLPPVAIADPPFQIVFIGEEAWFSGILSFDPDGYIVSYDWDFGDGTNGTGITTTHIYTSPGCYFVTLTVKDNDGATDTDTVMVMVQEPPIPNRPPVADAGKDRFASPFEELVFNGNGSFDLDGTIVGYQWDFGDGCTATGILVTHTYTDYRTYIVTLEVVDDEGATDTETCIVFVKNQNLSEEKMELKVPIPEPTTPKTPILILTAGLINIATFEDEIEKMVPLEVTAFYDNVNNVHIELIDDGGLDIEIIPLVQDVPEGRIVRFFLKIKGPELSDDTQSTGVTIKLKAVGDGVESNIEHVDVIIGEDIEESSSTSDVAVISTMGTITIAAVLGAIIGRRLL